MLWLKSEQTLPEYRYLTFVLSGTMNCSYLAKLGGGLSLRSIFKDE